MAAEGNTAVQLPDIVPGDWHGEFAGSATLRLGQVVQPTEPPLSVEFSQIIASVLLTMPAGKFTWPGVLIIAAPTPMKTASEEAGILLRSAAAPTLCLSLDVTRDQFSDLLRSLEAKRLRRFQLAVADRSDSPWPVTSWGMSSEVALTDS